MWHAEDRGGRPARSLDDSGVARLSTSSSLRSGCRRSARTRSAAAARREFLLNSATSVVTTMSVKTTPSPQQAV